MKEEMIEDIVQWKLSQIEQEMKKDDFEEVDPEKELTEFVRQWEADFNFANQDPENNSDFDSDNEINPVDTLRRVDPKSIEQGIGLNAASSKKYKPIQISVVGKPNIGKSTFVNSLLKEFRVVANDMPGTTRDSI